MGRCRRCNLEYKPLMHWSGKPRRTCCSGCKYDGIHSDECTRVQRRRVRSPSPRRRLTSQRMAVATPRFFTDQLPLCISFLPILDLVPFREATLECRNAVDCFLGSIDAMHRILTNFAVYDAGPTYWKVPRVPSIYGCSLYGCSNASPSLRYFNLETGNRADISNLATGRFGFVRVSAIRMLVVPSLWALSSYHADDRWAVGELYDLLGKQRDWMNGVAWGLFAEVTSAVPCWRCGRPRYIPFCELNHEVLNALGACSTRLSVPFHTPDDVDTYMWVAQHGPLKPCNQHEALMGYALAAIWRDLAPDGHVDQHEGLTHTDNLERRSMKWQRISERHATEWLHKAADRANVRKLWAMWSVSMKALLKVNIRMRLLIQECHIHMDPQHYIEGRVMKDTESVSSVLTYQVPGSIRCI